MPKLSRNDIDFIRLDLKKRGVGHSPLREELVDHVCCEVEELMQSGIPFKTAYEKLAAGIYDDQLVTVQDHTIQSENYNTIMLLRNNLKIMFRNMSKNISFTLINIGGLILGLLSFVVLSIYVDHELRFDQQFSNYESIYRITMSSTVGGSSNLIPTSYPTLGPALKDQLADIKDYTRIINYKYSRLVPTFQNGDKIFYEEKVIFADSSFFRVFDFAFAEGKETSALSNPNAVVITEHVARKYFGEESALGKHLVFNTTTEMEITGVLKDIPSNTHLQFDFIIPMSAIQNSGVFRSAKVLDSWTIDWFWTYLIIPEKNSIAKVEKAMDRMTDEKIPDAKKEHQARFYLQALKDVHLNSNFDYNTDLTENGSRTNLYIFGSVGVIVLLISSINFINISIATATKRYKEIGISKVLGAMRSQLRIQFILESVLVSVAALLCAFMVLQFVLPLFSELLGVKLELKWMRDYKLIGGIVSFVILMALISGVYPAFFVSSFDPQRVLKGVWKPGSGGAQFRRILVGIQIAISIFLVIGTVIIFQQMNFVRHKALGFDKEKVIMLNIRGTSIPRSYHALKHKLESHSSIESVSSVSEPIGREVQFMSFTVEGREGDQFIKILNVTHDFVKTMGLDIVKGRDFSRDFATDSTSGFIINESMANAYGWQEPIGKSMKHAFPSAPEGKIIGVVKDFNFEPLHKQIDPLVIWFGGPHWYVAVKVKSGNLQQSLSFLETTWREFEPAKPFSFHFLDQSIQKAYEKEQRAKSVFLVFSILSIVTASLGLFGLISFIAEQRLMEIGVRKVFGASVKNIVSLITKDYVMLVVLAFAVAAPLSYLVMDKWLEEFAFRMEWSPVSFAAGFLVIFLIVTTTVLMRVVRAARSNPVKVLRGE